ncbi:arylsulfatase A [Flaviramulus basaltis]|uniref:Arylsulfatase A n=1 Tax=Flaviramulus basaltis TaxID=369401 RepID=A0A1K2IB35_9FLAO|nr:sulfatase-like hydrolase/transferase [Flaviramulus basaltis]SFZ89454.1 arylsulfatase A [Flaviramulus basaltis]
MYTKYKYGFLIVTSIIVMTSFYSFKNQSKEDVSTKPNIIYILADDLGYGDVNFDFQELNEFNNPYIKTPNLAALAHQSVVFTQHYASSPVCSPSRAGLLTGKVPNRVNIDLFISDKKDNDRIFLSGKEVTIAELVKEEGYSTAIFGKWHLNGADWNDPNSWTGKTGSFPKQQGFDYGMVTKENPHLTTDLDKNSQKNPGDFFDLDGNPLGVIKGYSSKIITDNALQWLSKTQEKSDPFFLFLSYDAVHEFISNPDEYNNMYKSGDPDKDQYYANVTYLDHQIGRLMKALDAMKLRENTIIFFSSDNGPEVWRTNSGSGRSFGTSYPLHGQKRQLFEGGIKVPGLVSWKDKISPRICDAPIVNYDVLPTICDIANVNLNSELKIDGVSIYQYLLNNSPIERKKPLYWQFEKRRQNWELMGEGYNQRYVGNKPLKEGIPPQVVIRQNNYVLHGYSDKLYSKPNSYKLYDIEKDPLMTKDLSTYKPSLFEELVSKLEDMYEDVNIDRVKSAQEMKMRFN